MSPSCARLPEREYNSGLAEVIKTAIIGDGELFSLLEGSASEILAREPAIVEEMIRRCLCREGAHRGGGPAGERGTGPC